MLLDWFYLPLTCAGLITLVFFSRVSSSLVLKVPSNGFSTFLIGRLAYHSQEVFSNTPSQFFLAGLDPFTPSFNPSIPPCPWPFSLLWTHSPPENARNPHDISQCWTFTLRPKLDVTWVKSENSQLMMPLKGLDYEISGAGETWHSHAYFWWVYKHDWWAGLKPLPGIPHLFWRLSAHTH